MKILMSVIITYFTIRLISSIAKNTSDKIVKIEESLNDENMIIKTKERNVELFLYFSKFLFIGYVYLYVITKINEDILRESDNYNILSYSCFMN